MYTLCTVNQIFPIVNEAAVAGEQQCLHLSTPKHSLGRPTNHHLSQDKYEPLLQKV